jgi:DNA polymerase lambda
LKVKEILSHGFLERTAALASDAKEVAFREFCSVWGLGPKRAQVWVDRGLRSLDDVRHSEECMSELSSRERTGLRHAEDFRIRIPRQV